MRDCLLMLSFITMVRHYSDCVQYRVLPTKQPMVVFHFIIIDINLLLLVCSFMVCLPLWFWRECLFNDMYGNCCGAIVSV